jgi:hypothetical protein
MPAREGAVFKLVGAFGPANINQTAANAAAFAPGRSLSADFFYPRGSKDHDGLNAYLARMPSAVKESIRATLYHALTSSPAIPVVFMWRPAYYFATSIAQWPATDQREGAIALTIEGPFPDDPYSPAQTYQASFAAAGGSRKPSSKGAPKPASRKPSTRSKKSS